MGEIFADQTNLHPEPAADPLTIVLILRAAAAGTLAHLACFGLLVGLESLLGPYRLNLSSILLATLVAGIVVRRCEPRVWNSHALAVIPLGAWGCWFFWPPATAAFPLPNWMILMSLLMTPGLLLGAWIGKRVC